ncbi:MAG TPA: pyridoxamine 5'-phosphate oxidase family protein [Methylomirabilota bacterium]|nr:pyridoxamine 5'-phosphate oxidase family protein [Methylomirabilota bacterium]
MIPDRVFEVLHGPAYMQIGTRDAALRPSHTLAVGAVVHDDRETVTVFVPTARARRILADLESNGRVALGIALVSHEAYQLKGSYLSTRPTDASDLARQETYRKALLDDALRVGYPDEIARPLTQGFAYTPGTAITFRAEQVFLQTPGPGAGTPLA